jgi:hypothetical protein
VSKDYFGYAGNKAGSGLKGTNTGYLNLAYSKEIFPKVTLKAAVGYTNMSSDIRSLGYKSYVDYNVGASYDFGNGLSLAGSVQGANKQSSYLSVSNPGVRRGLRYVRQADLLAEQGSVHRHVDEDAVRLVVFRALLVQGVAHADGVPYSANVPRFALSEHWFIG